MNHVIRHVPKGDEASFRSHISRPGIALRSRGRGPRPSVQYHASLPAGMAERFSVYVGDTRGTRTFWDYCGWDAVKCKHRVKLGVSS